MRVGLAGGGHGRCPFGVYCVPERPGRTADDLDGARIARPVARVCGEADCSGRPVDHLRLGTCPAEAVEHQPAAGGRGHQHRQGPHPRAATHQRAVRASPGCGIRLTCAPLFARATRRRVVRWVNRDGADNSVHDSTAASMRSPVNSTAKSGAPLRSHTGPASSRHTADAARTANFSSANPATAASTAGRANAHAGAGSVEEHKKKDAHRRREHERNG